MIAPMATISVKHLEPRRRKDGSVAWYFRVVEDGKPRRVRLPGEPNSPEFAAAYQAAMRGEEVARKAGKGWPRGSLGALIDLWKRSADFQGCAPSTRRVRDNALAKIAASAGSEPVAAITRAVIVKGRDRRADRPEAANEFVKLMRALFRWSLDAGLVDANPARDVPFLKPKNRDGFHTWTDDEIARFEARWPIGTRERLAMDVLLYTGLRASDAIRIGRQHVRSGEIYLPAMQKTGEPILCPIIAPLAESLNAGPVGDLAFLVTTEGRPWSCPTSFGNWFRKACRSAGVPGSAHGLRKAGARIAAERGATEEQLKALYGWRSSKEASRYTRAANRQKMARASAELRIPERNGITLCHAAVSGVAKSEKKR